MNQADYMPKATASSWDSYKDALYKILDMFKPVNIFEFGPGVSTSIMAMYPSVQLIDSVEHDKAWYEKWKWEMPENVNLMFQPNMELYPETPGRVEKYDLIFVDGREREKCLYTVREKLTENGVVVLHDAERYTYQEPMSFYKFRFFFDDGHTAVLCDSQSSADRIGSLCE